jgi:hypothetical protein
MLGQWLQGNLWGNHRVLVRGVLRHADAAKNDWHQEFHTASDPAYRISAPRLRLRLGRLKKRFGRGGNAERSGMSCKMPWNPQVKLNGYLNE